MPMIPMQALVAFTHEGRRVSAGDTLEVPPLTAAVLRYQHRAECLPRVAVSAQAKRPRRTYKRRDLRAES